MRYLILSLVLIGCGTQCPHGRSLLPEEATVYAELEQCSQLFRVPPRVVQQPGRNVVYKGQAAGGLYDPECDLVIIPTDNALEIFKWEAMHHLLCLVEPDCDENHDREEQKCVQES